jgi:dTDP-4-dehydrorhamnose 3,5-epimerase
MEHGVTVPPTVAGVSFEERRVIADDRGAVLHFMRSDSPAYSSFGEVYFSEVRPGAVKGWGRHRRQTQNYIVPAGRVKVVLYDDRDGSPTRGVLAEWELGRPDAYGVLIIPPMIWYAFTALGPAVGLVANFADMPHDPAEAERLPIDGGPVAYAW